MTFNTVHYSYPLADHAFQAFIIYSCGLLASYLVKFPHRMCLSRHGQNLNSTDRSRIVDVQHVGNDLQAAQAEGRMIYARSLGILRAYSHTWPLAAAWANGLEKWFKDQNPKKISFQSGTMTDGVSGLHPTQQNNATISVRFTNWIIKSDRGASAIRPGRRTPAPERPGVPRRTFDQEVPYITLQDAAGNRSPT